MRYPMKTSMKEFCDTIATNTRYEKYRCWASKFPLLPPPSPPPLPLQTLLFPISLLSLVFRFPLLFVCVFPFSSKDVKGSTMSRTLAFWGFALLPEGPRIEQIQSREAILKKSSFHMKRNFQSRMVLSFRALSGRRKNRAQD